MSKLNSRVKQLIKIVLSISFLALIFWKFGFYEVLHNVKSVDPIYFSFAVILLPIMMLIRGFRWKIFMDKAGYELNIYDSSSLTYIGFFFSSFTPSKIGDFVKVLHTKGVSNAPISVGVCSVILEKLLDLALLIALSVVGSVLVLQTLGIPSRISWSVFCVIVLVAIFALLFCLKRRWWKRFLFILWNILDKGTSCLNKSIRFDKNGFLNLIHSVKNDKITLFLTFSSTLLAWLTAFAIGYLIVIALGVRMNFVRFLLLLSISHLVAILPMSISGLGTREAAMVFLFASEGIGPATSTTFSLLYAFVTLWLPAIFGGILNLTYIRR